MKKYKLYLGIIICVFMLSGCKKQTVDVENINNSVNNLLSNLPEEDYEINETKKNMEGELVSEIKKDKTKNELLISEDVFPSFGKDYDFSFDWPSNELPEEVTYLDNIWKLKTIPTPNLSYSYNNPSLYLFTQFEYGKEQIEKESYNERFIKLISDSIEKFGPYTTGDNTYINSINDLTKENNVVFLWDIMDCYIIESFEIKESQETSSVVCNIMFISKNNIHDAYGEESVIIAYIKQKIKNVDLNLLYQTEEGTFLIKEKEKNKNVNSIMNKYLN